MADDRPPVTPVTSSASSAGRFGAGQNPLAIGGLLLATTSCPRQIIFGAGEQKMAVHEMVGGSKVVHRMGFQPDALDWAGSAYQPDVQNVVETLRQYCVDGRERLVSWKAEAYYAIVRKQKPSYRSGGNIVDWTVSLEVTRDANGAFSGQRSAPSNDDTNSTLTASATSMLTAVQANAPTDPTSAAALDDLGAILASSATAVQNVTPGSAASPSAITSILATITSALASAQKYASLLPVTHISFVGVQQIVASLTLLRANISTPQSQRTITKQGGSLYEVAATSYGNIEKAFALLPGAGTHSPRLQSSIPTVIPLLPISANQ